MRRDVTGGSHPKRLLATVIKRESAAGGRTHGKRSVRCDGAGRREEGASVLVAAAPAVVAAATLQLASAGTVDWHPAFLCARSCHIHVRATVTTL